MNWEYLAGTCAYERIDYPQGGSQWDWVLHTPDHVGTRLLTIALAELGTSGWELTAAHPLDVLPSLNGSDPQRIRSAYVFRRRLSHEENSEDSPKKWDARTIWADRDKKLGWTVQYTSHGKLPLEEALKLEGQSGWELTGVVPVYSSQAAFFQQVDRLMIFLKAPISSASRQ